MLQMSWITAILQLYSQVKGLFGNVIVKRINIRLFELLARFHYILNPPRIMGKGKLTNFLSQWGYLEKYTELFIDYIPLSFIGLLSKALNLIGCRGGNKG